MFHGAALCPPLESILAAAHARDIPVFVDAAAQLPPAENLWRFTEMGADLVIFSGGKGLAGPQDSGLVVDALDGAPGVYSARYGGLDSDAARTAYLLKNMEQVPDDRRTARFVSVITACFPDGREIQVRGECEGVITREVRGDGGFGYDPIFYLPECGCTSAQLVPEKKNELSHRGEGLRKMREILLKKWEREDEDIDRK